MSDMDAQNIVPRKIAHQKPHLDTNLQQEDDAPLMGSPACSPPKLYASFIPGLQIKLIYDGFSRKGLGSTLKGNANSVAHFYLAVFIFLSHSKK